MLHASLPLPGRFQAFTPFLRMLLLVVTLASWNAGAQAENQALKLDGRGSYVQLPTAGFNTLTQATVEVWVKWDALLNYSRVFEYGATWKSVSLFLNGPTSDLRYNIYPRMAQLDESARAIRTNEWIHLAAVSGSGGMLLYINGRLVGQHTNTTGFPEVSEGALCYLGRGMVGNSKDADFRGEIDEVRIWNHRRSVAQIRESMFKRLTGREPGLVHLWNFDDGTANDAVDGAGVGKLAGAAVIVPSELGLVAELPPAPVATVPPVPPPQVLEVKSEQAVQVGWWIAGAITLLAIVLAWLAFMFRRSGLGSEKIVGPAPVMAQLPAHRPEAARLEPNSVPKELREQALAELTSFAKESLVQGLFSQRAALLEAQKQAQQELAQLEARLATLDVSDRILAYETRIADLERQVASRGEQVEGLTKATLQLLRKKLAEEKQRESAGTHFN